jgi:hypothetical protein
MLYANYVKKLYSNYLKKFYANYAKKVKYVDFTRNFRLINDDINFHLVSNKLFIFVLHFIFTT